MKSHGEMVYHQTGPSSSFAGPGWNVRTRWATPCDPGGKSAASSSMAQGWASSLRGWVSVFSLGNWRMDAIFIQLARWDGTLLDHTRGWKNRCFWVDPQSHGSHGVRIFDRMESAYGLVSKSGSYENSKKQKDKELEARRRRGLIREGCAVKEPGIFEFFYVFTLW